MYTEHFSIKNIPYGIASSASHPRKSVATRFQDTVIYLDELANFNPPQISEESIESFSQSTVNDFAALPRSEQEATRKWIQSHLCQPLDSLSQPCTSPISGTSLHLPLSIGDFTDFSCSIDHVLNAGEVVFGKRELPPCFEKFPIAYHGRASSIVVSGTPITRPKGQYKGADGKVLFGPTQKLDYELEIAAVVGKPSTLGNPVKIEDAYDHVFGLVLLNDWSARDIQGMEMVPFGPMNGKSFGTSISPWIITLEALAPFKTSAPVRNPEVELASYLQDPDPKSSFDIGVEVSLQPAEASVSSTVCTSKFSSMYWTVKDMIAQQTINGCSLNTGDLLATGTISGPTVDSHGCLMELSPKGGAQVKAADGGIERRIFLKDGDTVCLSASAGPGVGFGECVGKILEAKD